MGRRRQERRALQAAGFAVPRRRFRLAPRQIVGLVIVALMVYGLYYLVFMTNVMDPVIASLGPLQDGIAWVAEDPMRMIATAGALLIPHMGLYFWFLEQLK